MLCVVTRFSSDDIARYYSPYRYRKKSQLSAGSLHMCSWPILGDLRQWSLVVWGLPLGRIKQLIMASSVQVHDRKVWNTGTGEVGLYVTGLVVSKLFSVFRGVVLPRLTQHRC